MSLNSTTPDQAASVAQQNSPSPAAVIGPNPNPVPNGQQPNNQQAPTTTPQPNRPTVSADDVHSHIVGKVFKNVKNALGGRQVVYTPDPQTGTVQEQVVPRKPGGFFRDLIAGAFAGEAAASEPTAHPSGAVGLARGFVGEQQYTQNQQDRNFNLAQRNAQQQFARNKMTTEETLQAAAVAHDNMNSLSIGHFIPHFTDEEVSDYNDSVNAVKDVLLKNGSQVADVQGNGEKGNGPDLMTKYNNDPSLMIGPEGYHRVAQVTYDTAGLQHEGHQWVDPKTGEQPKDWNDRATVTLVDIPNQIWGKNVSLPGKVFQDVAPGTNLVKDPNKSYSTSIGSIFGLGLKNKQQMMDARNELYKAPQNEQEALALKSEADQINNDPDAPADLKRRAAIKGPLAEKWLANQAAQKKAMDDAGSKPPTAPKTLAEAAIARANAVHENSVNPSPDNKKAADAAEAAYQGALNAKRDEAKADYDQNIRLASGKADAERAAKEKYDRDMYSTLTSGDPFGWTPKSNQLMTEQQFNNAKEKFANGTLNKALDTEKSYQMFQDAYGEYKAANGKLPTGAQSMLALSTHLQTTFGNVKGSRVTKDMIREHLGARSVSDDAQVAIQKLTNGDVLSAGQWKAFNNLISDSRNKTWDNAVSQAHYQGLPADFVPQDYAQSRGGSAPSSYMPTGPVSRPASAPRSTSGGFNWNNLPKVQ